MELGNNGFVHKNIKYFSVINSDELFSNADGSIIYQFKNGKYHLIKDSRLSDVIQFDEIYKNCNFENEENSWK